MQAKEVNSRLSLYNGTDWVDMPIKSEIPISISKSITDVREPDKIKSSSSKTVVIPFSNSSIQFFEFIHLANVSLNVFDPNLKTKAVYYQNEREALRGHLQLLKINKRESGDVMDGEFECSLIGVEGNVFLDIGDAYLTDLDFSDLNHTFNQLNALGVPGGNSPTIGSGYAYGFIDYGYGDTTNQTWKLSDLKMGIFEREYLKRILAAQGYTWTSTFLDSTYYKHRWIPDVNDGRMKQPDATIAATQYYATISAPSTNTISGNFTAILFPAGQWTFNGGLMSGYTVIPCDDDFTPPYFDGGSCYNAATYIFTAQTSATFIVNVDFSTQIQATINGGTSPPGALNVDIYAELQYYNGASWVSFAMNGYTGLQVDNVYAASASIQTQSAPTFLSAGTQVRAVYRYQPNGFLLGNNTDTVNLTVLTGAGTNSYAKVSDASIIFGQTVVANSTVPKNVKQKDFFKSIIQTYNLRIEPDKTDPYNLIIEPYTSFYNSAASALNWTTKRDIDRDIEQIPMGDLDARTYEFQNKQDSDIYNAQYFDEFKMPYGKSWTNINNDFINQTKTTEVIFSPTPIVSNVNNQMVVPKLYKMDNGQVKTMACNIRSLYYGGLQSCGTYWFDVNGTISPQTTYPFVGHVDNPYSTTLDLCFDNPWRIYWTIPAQTYTTNNIYNAYWKQFIQEITNKDAKIIRAWFYLDEIDISQFTFRNLVYFETPDGGVYCRVNRIMDFSPIERKTTQVEFVKIKAADAFSPTYLSGVGYGSGSGANIVTQGYAYSPTGNYVNQNSQAFGTGNNALSGSGLIIGDNNIIANG